MLEAAAIYIVAQQRVNDRVTVLDEPGVGIRIDAQSGQCGNDLRNGFAGGNLRRAVVGGGVAAVLVLHLGEPRDSLVDGLLYLQILRVIGSQSGQRHAGHVGIGLVAGDSPAAVGGLHTQNFINERLTGDGAAGGYGVVAGIQRQQRPDGAVVALVLHEVQIAQALQQVIAAHVGHVAANGRQRQNDPGVIRGFRLVEPSGFGVDVLGHVLQNLLVVVLHAGDVPVGTGQTDDHPLAADGADAGRTQSLHVVAGGDVGIADLAHGLQHGKLGLGGGQNIVVVNQLLLQVGQGIVSLAGGLDILFGIRGHVLQLVNEVDDLLRLFLVLFRSRELRIGGLGVGELLDVRDQILLILGQSVISLAGSFNTGLALFRDGVFDLVNKLDNLVGLELVPLPGGFLEGGELRDQFLLLSLL